MTRGRPKLNRKNCCDCDKKIDGKSKSYCKNCTNKRIKITFSNPENRERKRVGDREYQRKKRARLKGYKTAEYKKYREKYPEKVRAQQLLNRAILRGKIKVGLCEVCGTDKNIRGHHDDYTKPLEVKWVCEVHHKEIHKKIK